jgi:hypothetical protein
MCWNNFSNTNLLAHFWRIFMFILKTYLFLVVWKYILICLVELDNFQLYFHSFLSYFISLYAWHWVNFKNTYFCVYFTMFSSHVLVLMSLTLILRYEIWSYKLNQMLIYSICDWCGLYGSSNKPCSTNLFKPTFGICCWKLGPTISIRPKT